MRVCEISDSMPLPFMSNSVSAGFPSPATDYIEDRIDLNEMLVKHPSSTFFIRVEGDSMIDAFIPSQSVLVIDRSLSAQSNDIIVAALDGEFTVKRFIVNNKGTFLYPENKKYKPIQITSSMDFVCWGVVTSIIISAKEI